MRYIKKFFVIAVILVMSMIELSAQRKMTTAEYIDTYSPWAIEQMVRYKIPASIILAQGILESGNGGSRLAREANNHFGIKCSSTWKGPRMYHDDDSKGECFRKYRSARESFADHSIFLSTSKRYASLFDLDITDYRAWARGLKAAGYATNPQYAPILIKLIEDNELHKFDVGMKPSRHNVVGGLFGDRHKRFEGISPKLDFNGREWGWNNGVKFVVAKANDSFASLSIATGISVKKLLRFNDLTAEIELAHGTAVYVQKKKNRCDTSSLHVVESGETVHSIAQKYGISVQALMRKNPDLRKSAPRSTQQLKL